MMLILTMSCIYLYVVGLRHLLRFYSIYLFITKYIPIYKKINI